MFSKQVATTLFSAFLFSFSLQAAPTNLSPVALDCYVKNLANPENFTMSKDYKPDFSVEKMVVSMCTYSDAEGSSTCYKQAKDQPEFLFHTKDTSDVFELERIYSVLCSNSHAGQVNSETGDMEAVDCVKKVMADEEVLVSSKNFTSKSSQEQTAIQLCISSNALGAITCYKNSIQKAEEILRSTRKYTGPGALDKVILDLCKGSRL